MALDLKILACQADDCKSITFTDNTGDYDGSSNPGGWGAPNTEKSAILTSQINVTIAAVTHNIVTTGILPAASTYTINPTDIGLASGATIPSGAYTFEFELTTATETLKSNKVDFLLYCETKCKVFAKILELDPDCVLCDLDQQDKIIESWAFLKSLEMTAVWSKQTKFTELITHIDKLIDNLCNRCV